MTEFTLEHANLKEQDAAQRQQALDPRKSFIVQAPAGSGKTELLIQRFLTLLANVKAPEEALAITFTKKAASEMRARLVKAIKTAHSEPEPESAHAKLTWKLAKAVLERDKEFHWNLLQNPNQMRIQTIDSLCSYLTRQLPLLSHFGSQPDTTDSPTVLYSEAVQEVLSHVEDNVEWSPAIAQLLLHLDNDLNKLHDLLVTLLAKRDQWLGFIHLDTRDEVIRQQLEYHLAMVIEDQLQALLEVFPSHLVSEVLYLARYAAGNLELSQADSPIRDCLDIESLPDTEAFYKPVWIGIATLLLTQKGEWRKRFAVDEGFPPPSGTRNPQEKALFEQSKKRAAEVIGQLQEHEDLRHRLASLTALPHPHYQDDQWDILKSLLLLLKIVAAQLRVTFQKYGKVDFIENARAALTALGSDEVPTDLALALDYQIKHILIDEFQDTSFSQFQLIERLLTGWEANDGRTLFIVGDPMQSIYRFREAEVGLFIRMRKEGIGHVKLTPLTLSVNFRSSAAVVEWNNRHFKAIFPRFNDMATGAVSYSPSAANEVQGSATSYIDIQGFDENNKGGQEESIVRLIQDTQAHFPGEKIAILVRSRSHLAALIPALKAAKLAYRAISIDPLVSRQCIQDLLALTCALLHPADRIAWLAILRAPWCGLTLSDLLALTQDHPHAAIWELLKRHDNRARLSADGSQRLSRFLEVISTKIADRERDSLRHWVESTWLALGGPACLQDYADIDDVNAYFSLLTDFSIEDLSINLDRLKEKINRLYADTPGNDDLLQIMTIHTAKGLEFDTVILPHLQRITPNDEKSLLLWMDRPLANDKNVLLLAPLCAVGEKSDAIYSYIAGQQKIKLTYETDRLLYVATTRAKKRLHLLFNHTQSTSGSFLKNLLPAIENEIPAVPLTSVNENTISEAPSDQQRKIARLPSSWTNPVASPPVQHTQSHQQQEGFTLTPVTLSHIGSVTHQILQYLAEKGIPWWQSQTNEQHVHYLRTAFRSLGTNAQAIPQAISATLNNINNTLKDPKGQWILHPHSEAKSEYALTALINNQIENIIIDRTFVDENNIRWIIDYKTTSSADEVDNAHIKQLKKYHAALTAIEKSPIKLGLYFPALSEWKEIPA